MLAERRSVCLDECLFSAWLDAGAVGLTDPAQVPAPGLGREGRTGADDTGCSETLRLPTERPTEPYGDQSGL